MAKTYLEPTPYGELEVEDGRFVPDVSVDYPSDDPFKHIMPVKKPLRDIKFDDTYPYLDESFRYKWEHFKCYVGLVLAAMPLNRIKYGLVVKGRSKFLRFRKKHRGALMTVCNHVYRWDMISILTALRYRRAWIPMYAPHFLGKDAWFMRYIGGIPVPEEPSGLRPFNAAFDEYCRRGEWVHFFPESCSWKFYTPIRTFRKGAFKMAWTHDMPVLPLAISYRRRHGIFKLFGPAEEPLVTITIGDPIMPDKSRPKGEEVERLCRESHAQMVSMAGIVSNPWPACEADLKQR